MSEQDGLPVTPKGDGEQEVRSAMGSPKRVRAAFYEKRDLGKRPMTSQSVGRVMLIGGGVIGLGFLVIIFTGNDKPVQTTSTTPVALADGKKITNVDDARSLADDENVAQRLGSNPRNSGRLDRGRRVSLGGVGTAGAGSSNEASGAIGQLNREADALGKTGTHAADGYQGESASNPMRESPKKSGTSDVAPVSIATVASDGSNLGRAVVKEGITSVDIQTDQGRGVAYSLDGVLPDGSSFGAPSGSTIVPRGSRASRKQIEVASYGLPTRVLGSASFSSGTGSMTAVGQTSVSDLNLMAQRASFLSNGTSKFSEGALGGGQVAADASGNQGPPLLVRIPRASDFVLIAGSKIPITLDVAASSEICGGTFVAHVSQDVTESLRKHDIVLPDKTRILGKVQCASSGQRKQVVYIDRFIFPDGSSMMLPHLTVADPDGTAGMTGSVNDHRGRLLTIAGITAVLSSIPIIATGGGGTVAIGATQTAGQVAGGQVASQIASAGSQVLASQVNQAPSIDARDGREYSLVLDFDIPFAAPYSPYPVRPR